MPTASEVRPSSTAGSTVNASAKKQKVKNKRIRADTAAEAVAALRLQRSQDPETMIQDALAREDVLKDRPTDAPGVRASSGLELRRSSEKPREEIPRSLSVSPAASMQYRPKTSSRQSSQSKADLIRQQKKNIKLAKLEKARLDMKIAEANYNIAKAELSSKGELHFGSEEEVEVVENNKRSSHVEEWVEQTGLITEKIQKVCEVTSNTEDCVSDSNVMQPASDKNAKEKERVRRLVHTVQNADQSTPSAFAKKKSCPHCGREHWLTECEKFLEATVDDRWEFTKKYRLCFRCLKAEHSNCNCQAKLCPKCKHSHHSLLHTEMKTDNQLTEKEALQGSSNHVAISTQPTVNEFAYATDGETMLYLKVMPVEIYGPAGSVRVLAMFDEGSALTLIEASVAKKIGATGEKGMLSLETVDGETQKKYDKFDVVIRGTNKSENVLRNVFTRENLRLTPQSVALKDIKKYKHFHGIEDKLVYEWQRPALLIGHDHIDLIESFEIRENGMHAPRASLTRLGWVFHGYFPERVTSTKSVNHCSDSSQEENVENLIKQHFELDSIGVQRQRPSNDADERALCGLKTTTTQLHDGGFESGHVWKPDAVILPNSHAQAYEHLKGMKKKATSYKESLKIEERKWIPISEEQLGQAEKALIKRAQYESFSKDINGIKENTQLESSSKLKKLDVILEDSGLLRLNCRTAKVENIDGFEKRLPVLDEKSKISQLLIDHYHCHFYHASNSTVVNELRQKYWILSLRDPVKKIVHQGQWCRVKKAKTATPPLGDLPIKRLQHSTFPFTCTAVDYFGPMHVTIGKRKEKRWGAFFTCLTTRAVHLELACSLNASSMIMGLRRMSSRRGSPRVLYSDNATNFVGANNELKMEIQKMKSKNFVEAAEQEGIQWKFTPPGAPHMGGAWERMVRSVKTALAVMLQERSPPEEVLHTLLTEVEHTVNSRPLTHFSMDPGDEEALTPNHFLIGRSCGSKDIGIFDDANLVGKANWKTTQRLADHFWRRWIKECLPTLRPRKITGRNNDNDPQKGDIVIIADSSQPRNTWPRGEIIETYSGPDGRTRDVSVRTASNVLKRPTSRLIVTVPASSRQG